jgi:hypothetical protein
VTGGQTILDEIAASVCGGEVCVTFRHAAPLALHGADLPRTDGNSPVMVDADGCTAYYSHYIPRGHSYRRDGGPGLDFTRDAVPVRFVDDPDPGTGKWIEAVWPAAEPGGLYGLFHAEVLAPCDRPLFLPEIRIGHSADRGVSWRSYGTILRAPETQTDCSYRNGFFAGGFGDLSALPDRAGRFHYIAFTSFVAEEAAQGIAMARLDRANPFGAGVDWWTRDGWRPAGEAGALPQPLWPMRRGWRHPDPDGYWGPAVHYNRGLDAYVMLLNHTAGGAGDLVQEGIYAAFNSDLADPRGWSAPLRIVAGGGWYPQAVGLEPGCSDTYVAGRARFFMGGYSAWTVDFARADRPDIVDRPLRPTRAMFAELFGTRHKAPW